MVIDRYAKGDYCAKDWYESDPNIRRAIDFLTGPQMQKYGCMENLSRLRNELIGKDWFQTLPDFMHISCARTRRSQITHTTLPTGTGER